MTVIDLRSDTVTQPTPAMRRVMADARVGDDVYGEDPTVNQLQETVATLLGTEAALFVPSGTMANQIAVAIQTKPGQEMLVGADAHNWLYETGGTAAISGVQHRVIAGDGRFTGDDVRKHYNPDDHHHAATRLVSVENTHNMGGGLLWDPGDVRDVLAAARELGLASHLDGARLWNAAVAQQIAERELCRGFDTVSVCLSKGLGAPVGSVLAGSEALVGEAHRMRKMLGGGMRQAGILAAAGLYALEHNRERLALDHENAALLANELAQSDNLTVNLDAVRTNIVLVEIAQGTTTAAETVERAKKHGVLFYALGEYRLRLVTHLDISATQARRAARVVCQAVDAS